MTNSQNLDKEYEAIMESYGLKPSTGPTQEQQDSRSRLEKLIDLELERLDQEEPKQEEAPAPAGDLISKIRQKYPNINLEDAEKLALIWSRDRPRNIHGV